MLISIITINYNNAVGLRKTIESVISQTYKNIEYIIIDGGSTDGSIDVIKDNEYNIVYWVSEPDDGIYNAMNKGLLKATGSFLLFINAGDILYSPKTVQEFISAASNTDFRYDVYTGNLIAVYANGNINTNFPPNEMSVRFIFSSTLSHPASFIKKDCFSKVGCYNEEMLICSDWEFFMKAFLIFKVTYLPLSLDVVLFDTSGISSKAESLSIIKKERETTLQKHFPLFYKDYFYYTNIEHRLRVLENEPVVNFYLKRVKKKLLPFKFWKSY